MVVADRLGQIFGLGAAALQLPTFGGEGDEFLHTLRNDAHDQMGITHLAVAVLFDGDQLAFAEAVLGTGVSRGGQLSVDALAGQADADLMLIGEEGAGLGCFALEGSAGGGRVLRGSAAAGEGGNQCKCRPVLQFHRSASLPSRIS
ncbi:hypothetical protein D3C81_1743170 [compost metagenome]